MTFNGLNVLLADAPQVENPTGQKIVMFGYIAIFFVIMWVLVFGPQRKKEKEQRLMLGKLRNGDKIITTSGILGVVLSIKDKSVSIRSADTKLEILKSAIAEVTEHSGDSGETKS